MRPLLAVPVLLLAACGHGTPKPEATYQDPRSRVQYDCEHLAYEPTTILVACGDGAEHLEHVTYDSWTDVRATGHATVIANDFMPNRAEGHDKAYPATFVLEAPVAAHGGLVFTRLVVRYPGANPYGDAVETDPLWP